MKPLYLVLQHGGSAREFYAKTYSTFEEAEKSVERRKEASYNAVLVKIPPTLSRLFDLVKVSEREFTDLVQEIAQVVSTEFSTESLTEL